MRLILFALLSVLSITLQAQENKVYQDTIPFRTDLGIIIIPMSFNGVEKEFMFDTGAEVSLGYSWIKEELKPTSKALELTSSNNSKTRLRYYKSGTINLGKRTIEKHRILASDDGDIFTCFDIDGVLGVDIIQLFNWTIDFEKNILIMSPSDLYPEEVKKMHALDFDFKGNRPYVFMKMNGKRIPFLFDTGATNSDINKKKYNLTQLDTYDKVKMHSGFYDFNGTLTPTAATVVRLPEVTSNNVRITPFIDYGKKHTKIGNSLWKGKRLFMSLKDDRLFINDNDVKENRLSHDVTAVIDNGNTVVLRIKEGSEAWNLGIRQGDHIKTVNGKLFKDFCTLSQFQHKITQEDGFLEFVFANGIKITTKQKPLTQNSN